MKKTIIVLSFALLTLASNFAHSEESQPEKLEADANYVLSLLMQCKDYAQEDEVTQSDMNKYLLTCINDELDLGYYLPIKVLPKEEVVEGEPK
jgi:hypothetical protein